MNRFTKLFVLLMVASMATISVSAQINFLSGVRGGTYEALANDIKSASSQEIRLKNSMGSVDNCRQLITPDNDIFVSFLQYDVLLVNELQNPNLRDELRVLLPLFLNEEVHLITMKDSEINSLKDLRGKRVAVGARDQGTYVTAQTIKQRTHTAWRDVEMHSSEAYKALLNGQIDAFFYVGGAPVSSIYSFGNSAPIKLVNIESASLEDIYTPVKIKKGTYAWQDESVTTYAVTTLLVVNTKNMTNDIQHKLNMLLLDIEKAMKTFQKTGHPKWQDVYTKNQLIDWPYYL